jgi:glyoxylase-like metal-dependent hydrolase (beta-lactamase superfamily II)
MHAGNLDCSRRGFLRTAAALPLLNGDSLKILPGLSVFPGAVNTALAERNGKKLLIDSGDWTAAPGGGAAEWALFTHRHRDQAAGAPRLARTGTKLLVPLAERRFFEDMDGFWDAAESVLYHQINEFRSPLFSLRESAPVARGVRDGDVHAWEGLQFEVVETPGHTDGSVTYVVEIGGKRVAFTGDLIYGPGQIWEIYSLQKRFPRMRGDYWGFGGAVADIKASLDKVLARKPDLLVPSHGAVIHDPAAAVASLKANVDAAMENYLTAAGWRIYFQNAGELTPEQPPRMFPALPPAAYPKWIRDVGKTTSKMIVADDKSVFLSDCGSSRAVEELARMRAAKEIGAIEGLWITHYHDDHTEYVNVAKRRFGTKVYVQRQMADIIENPTAYQMPCLFPEAIRVDRILEHGESFQWKEFRLTAFHFPGQTEYHTGLLVERDGYKVFFTGDSFTNWGLDDYCSQNRCFLGEGAGYLKCIEILLKTKPDMLVAAHWGPSPVTPESLRKTAALLREREKLLGRLFPHENPNFGLDPYWIRAYPYRQMALPGALVTVEARVMNHSAKRMTVRAGLRLPAGWKAGTPAPAQAIPPRTEGRIRLSAMAPPAPQRRRQVLGLAATVDGKPLGEFAEAIVDIAAQ